MDEFGLKGGGPSAATCPETKEDILECNEGGEEKLRTTVTTLHTTSARPIP